MKLRATRNALSRLALNHGLRKLGIPLDNNSPDYFLPSAVAELYTEHSARGFMPGLAFALNVSEEDRRFLGRWTPKASVDDYVRGSRDKVLRLVHEICNAVKSGWRPDESWTLEQILRLTGSTHG